MRPFSYTMEFMTDLDSYLINCLRNKNLRTFTYFIFIIKTIKLLSLETTEPVILDFSKYDYNIIRLMTTTQVPIYSLSDIMEPNFQRTSKGGNQRHGQTVRYI